MTLRSIPVVVALVAAALAATVVPAEAKNATIVVGEVSPPPPGAGLDLAGLRAAANAEIDQLDATRLPKRRRVIVSLALTRAAASDPVSCTVNAMVRDARTGKMIAIVHGGASAAGPASHELRREVARAAVRSAVRRIPSALTGP